MSVRQALDAVVFDFDGLLVDTEWSIYEMAATTFAEFGIDLAVPVWATIVGLAGRERLVGPALRRERLGHRPGRVVAALRLARPQLPRPPAGAARGGRPARRARGGRRAPRHRLELVAGVDRRPPRRLGLRDRFATVAGVDRTGVGKPAPDVYLLACEDLGADPARSVAVEDSGHGIAAAKAAGLACVAVPSRITRHTDLSAADLTVASLAELRLADLGAAGRRRRAAG